MLETYFSAAKMPGHLRSGPSGPYLDGFAAALEQQGYGPETAVRYLRAAAHIGHVMAEQGAGLTDIDLAAFGEHLRTHRPADRTPQAYLVMESGVGGGWCRSAIKLPPARHYRLCP
jgi:hypothetical protein